MRHAALGEVGQGPQTNPAELDARSRADDDDFLALVVADMNGDALIRHGDGADLFARLDMDVADAETPGKADGLLGGLWVGRPLDDGRDHQREAENEKNAHGDHDNL
ncbi:hypothetical protein DBT54_09820 [Aerococcus loyolae]|uniref:Uncharacterized protein n=1 Tax=Aerococcus urinae TaxID=1376 RepID=A0A329NUC7_9LACT|nr:hypothetical protein DBT54_09820 [Aerococcus loyolae]